VDWRLNDADRRGYERLLQVLRAEFPRHGLGHIVEHGLYEPDGWPSGMIAGKHHMGTTRMHPDRRQGVVDADCRVHGIGNLYVTGSSVFPTGGYANPTLTIAALAIRLADRIKAQLRGSER
jgi:choline dehydrogenase-like flavoprotein